MRYFFDLDGDGGAIADTDGMECSNALEMRRKALKILADVAGDIRPEGEQVRLQARVRDIQGSNVYEASLVLEGREPV